MTHESSLVFRVVTHVSYLMTYVQCKISRAKQTYSLCIDEQCLERYEKLLDEAMRTEGQAPDDADDPRRLRPGEIDPNPECKPARPDPVCEREAERESARE